MHGHFHGVVTTRGQAIDKVGAILTIARAP